MRRTVWAEIHRAALFRFSVRHFSSAITTSRNNIPLHQRHIMVNDDDPKSNNVDISITTLRPYNNNNNTIVITNTTDTHRLARAEAFAAAQLYIPPRHPHTAHLGLLRQIVGCDPIVSRTALARLRAYYHENSDGRGIAAPLPPPPVIPSLIGTSTDNGQPGGGGDDEDDLEMQEFTTWLIDALTRDENPSERRAAALAAVSDKLDVHTDVMDARDSMYSDRLAEIDRLLNGDERVDDIDRALLETRVYDDGRVLVFDPCDAFCMPNGDLVKYSNEVVTTTTTTTATEEQTSDTSPPTTTTTTTVPRQPSGNMRRIDATCHGKPRATTIPFEIRRLDPYFDADTGELRKEHPASALKRLLHKQFPEVAIDRIAPHWALCEFDDAIRPHLLHGIDYGYVWYPKRFTRYVRIPEALVEAIVRGERTGDAPDVTWEDLSEHDMLWLEEDIEFDKTTYKSTETSRTLVIRKTDAQIEQEMQQHSIYCTLVSRIEALNEIIEDSAVNRDAALQAAIWQDSMQMLALIMETLGIYSDEELSREADFDMLMHAQTFRPPRDTLSRHPEGLNIDQDDDNNSEDEHSDTGSHTSVLESGTVEMAQEAPMGAGFRTGRQYRQQWRVRIAEQDLLTRPLTYYDLFRPGLEQCFHEGELPDLTALVWDMEIWKKKRASSRRELYNSEDIKMLRLMLLKGWPQHSQGRTLRNSTTDQMLQHPRVLDCFLRAWMCTLSGYYSNDTTAVIAKWEVRHELWRNFCLQSTPRSLITSFMNGTMCPDVAESMFSIQQVLQIRCVRRALLRRSRSAVERERRAAAAFVARYNREYALNKNDPRAPLIAQPPGWRPARVRDAISRTINSRRREQHAAVITARKRHDTSTTTTTTTRRPALHERDAYAESISQEMAARRLRQPDAPERDISERLYGEDGSAKALYLAHKEREERDGARRWADPTPETSRETSPAYIVRSRIDAALYHSLYYADEIYRDAVGVSHDDIALDERYNERRARARELEHRAASTVYSYTPSMAPIAAMLSRAMFNRRIYHVAYDPEKLADEMQEEPPWRPDPCRGPRGPGAAPGPEIVVGGSEEQAALGNVNQTRVTTLVLREFVLATVAKLPAMHRLLHEDYWMNELECAMGQTSDLLRTIFNAPFDKNGLQYLLHLAQTHYPYLDAKLLRRSLGPLAQLREDEALQSTLLVRGRIGVVLWQPRLWMLVSAVLYPDLRQMLRFCFRSITNPFAYEVARTCGEIDVDSNIQHETNGLAEPIDGRERYEFETIRNVVDERVAQGKALEELSFEWMALTFPNVDLEPVATLAEVRALTERELEPSKLRNALSSMALTYPRVYRLIRYFYGYVARAMDVRQFGLSANVRDMQVKTLHAMNNSVCRGEELPDGVARVYFCRYHQRLCTRVIDDATSSASAASSTGTVAAGGGTGGAAPSSSSASGTSGSSPTIHWVGTCNVSVDPLTGEFHCLAARKRAARLTSCQRLLKTREYERCGVDTVDAVFRRHFDTFCDIVDDRPRKSQRTAMARNAAEMSSRRGRFQTMEQEKARISNAPADMWSERSPICPTDIYDTTTDKCAGDVMAAIKIVLFGDYVTRDAHHASFSANLPPSTPGGPRPRPARMKSSRLASAVAARALSSTARSTTTDEVGNQAGSSTTTATQRRRPRQRAARVDDELGGIDHDDLMEQDGGGRRTLQGRRGSKADEIARRRYKTSSSESTYIHCISSKLESIDMLGTALTLGGRTYARCPFCWAMTYYDEMHFDEYGFSCGRCLVLHRAARPNTLLDCYRFKCDICEEHAPLLRYTQVNCHEILDDVRLDVHPECPYDVERRADDEDIDPVAELARPTVAQRITRLNAQHVTKEQYIEAWKETRWRKRMLVLLERRAQLELCGDDQGARARLRDVHRLLDVTPRMTRFYFCSSHDHWFIGKFPSTLVISEVRNAIEHRNYVRTVPVPAPALDGVRADKPLYARDPAEETDDDSVIDCLFMDARERVVHRLSIEHRVTYRSVQQRIARCRSILYK